MAELNTKEELFGVITTNETIEGNINPSGKIVASMIAPKGAKGDPGEDGITPTIGENGNWYLDEIDTGKPSRGLPGEKGEPGETGSTGNGIESITLSSTSGKIKTYTILFTNDTTTTFNVSDGEDGLIGHDGKGLEFNWSGTQLGVRVEGTSEYTYVDLKGSKGDPGEAGQDGVSPTVTTSKSGKVTTITITDAQGTHTATILDGSDGGGSGDMLKSTYDTNENGIVDNAEKVNNHTVNADVPSNAVFTDTTYTAGTGIDITDGVISSTQTSAEWGNISGTLSNQTDLQNALNNKQNTISDLDTIRSGASLGATALQSYTETDPVFNASAASGITSIDINNWNNKSTFSGNYNDLSNKPTIPTKTSDLTNDSGYIDNTYHDNTKQDTLVSGTNIKTIDGNSILGSGNLDVSGDTLPIGAITEFDGNTVPDGYELVSEMSGSNVYGKWVKYADGTMICTREIAITNVTLSTQWGSWYMYENTITYDFAQTFIETPHIQLSFIATSPAGACLGNYGDCVLTTSSYKGFMLFRPTTQTVTGKLFIEAIGRWK